MAEQFSTIANDDQCPAEPARVMRSGRLARWSAAIRSVGATVVGLGRVSVLTGVAGALPPVGGLVLLGTLPVVGPWLGEQHGVGVAIYIAAFTLLAGLALLPTYAQAILGGAAFGFVIGFPAALMGFSGAAALSYALTGRIAGRRMMDMIEARPKWKLVHRALVESGKWRALWLVTLLRLPPMSPFAMVNVVLASARVPRGPYLLGTLLGLAPRTGVAVFAASVAMQFDPNEYRSSVPIVVGLVLSIVVVIVIGHMARRAVQQMANGAKHGKRGEGGGEGAA